MRRRAVSAPLLVLVLLATAIGLAGCGKKGAPAPPGPPSAVIYPRSYPAY